MTVLTELNSIIELLEAEIPANPESSVNLRLKDKLTKRMAKYFRDLGNAFPYSKLESIYNKNVEKE